MKCQLLQVEKFGKAEEYTGYDGSEDWKALHKAVGAIGCDYCRGKAIRLMRGLHDSVNVHLDKSPHYPKDLEFLFKHVLWSMQKKINLGLKCSLC